jgi:riboflavin kinase
MTDPTNLPIRIISKVVRGYGRGSKDLGIPTANISRDDLSCSCGDFDHLPTGIYYGFARIVIMGNDESTSNGHDDDSANDTNNSCNESELGQVFTAAISIGYNPTYNNSEKTVEPHLIAPAMHPKRHASMTGETQFQDFYDKTIVLSVVGYLRPELPFEGLEKLTAAIKKDIINSERLAGDESNSTTIAEREWVRSALGNEKLSG